MAILHASSSGNLQTLATWKVVNATSYVSARSTVAAVGTSFTGPASGTTPGAITIEGLLVLIGYRSLTPSGTFSAVLFNHTAASNVAGTQVTINVNDLPQSTQGTGLFGIGWVYMKLASPVTLLAGNAYSIRLSTTSTQQIFAWRTAAANTWIQALVTNASPGSFVTGDSFIITGTNTAPGVSTTATVTMNQTGTAPVWGSSTTGLENFISQGGTLEFGTAGGTNYRLPIQSNLILSRGGTFTIGTQANPIPSTSSALFDINCTSVGQFAFFHEGGVFETCGATKKTWTLLAADVAAGATTSTTVDTTGWLNGDRIVFGSTTRTATNADSVLMTGNASGTTLTHNALSFAHGGNASTLVQGEVGNLDKNVVIGSGNASFPAFIAFRGYAGQFTSRYTEFIDLGTTGASSAALAIQPSQYNLGDIFIDECAWWRSTLAANFIGISFNTSTSELNSFVLQNSVIHQYGVAILWTNASGQLTVNPPVIQDCFINRPANYGIGFTEPQLILRRNRITGCNDYAYLSTGLFSTPPLAWGEKLDNVAHSNASYGFNHIERTIGLNTIPLIWDGSVAWRNNTAGWIFNANYSSSADDFIFNNMIGFGNTVHFHTNQASGDFTINDSYLYGGSTLVAAALISTLTNNASSMLRFNNCYFGLDQALNSSPFASAVYTSNGATTRASSTVAFNCQFSGTEALLTSGIGGLYDNRLGFVSLKHNGVSDSHRVFHQTGYYQTDTAIFKDSSPSIRMFSVVAGRGKMNSNLYRIPVNAGSTCQVSVWVRKSTTTDVGGVNYNGAEPRLIWRYNSLAGNTADTVAATATAGLGVWEQLTYTTGTIPETTVLEFLIDCDGSTGWVNIDDWSSTTSNDSRNLKYFGVPGSYAEIDYNVGGSSEHSYTFIS
jgi:hypothetical protein